MAARHYAPSRQRRRNLVDPAASKTDTTMYPSLHHQVAQALLARPEPGATRWSALRAAPAADKGTSPPIPHLRSGACADRPERRRPLTQPSPHGRHARTKGSAVNHPHITQQQVQRAEELVSWTCRERIRFLWYRLRMTVREMNYVTGQMIELHMYVP
jgi:hypothetical protein